MYKYIGNNNNQKKDAINFRGSRGNGKGWREETRAGIEEEMEGQSCNHNLIENIFRNLNHKSLNLYIPLPHLTCSLPSSVYCDIGYWAQGLKHNRKALCHWSNWKFYNFLKNCGTRNYTGIPTHPVMQWLRWADLSALSLVAIAILPLKESATHGLCAEAENNLPELLYCTEWGLTDGTYRETNFNLK